MSDLPIDLSLTEDQRLMRETVQRFAERQITPVARQYDEAGQTPAAFYEAALELGLNYMPVPEAHGGAGQPREPLSSVLTAEDLGRGDLSLGLGILAPLGVIHALVDFGSDEQQAQFLPRLLGEGFVPAAIALMEGRATFEPSELTTKAVRDGDNYVISGEKRLVIHGSSAELLLVVAEEEGAGPQAFVVEKGAAGLSASGAEYMGLRPLDTATVVLDKVKVPAANRLANFDLQRLVDLSTLAVDALAVGTCQAVLDAVVPYVNERKAFGEPIAWRQSVAFMAADIAIELDAMRLMVWRAASRAQQGLPFHREAYLAHVLCMDKAMEIGTNGLQLFGGAGFTRDYPLEMWYRNLRALKVLVGAALA